MQITYKGKKHQIKCDQFMPMYAEDYSDPVLSGECCQTMKVCKQCILKHLGEEQNEGWDDEGNISYDMCITICDESVTI